MSSFVPFENEQISSDPAWIELLEKTKVIDLVDPEQRIVSVNYFEYLSTLLTKLSEAQILAAVISVSDKPGILGFVDVLDILYFVMDSAFSSETEDFSLERVATMRWHEKSLSVEPVGNLINYSGRDEMKTVEYDASLSTVVNMFSTEIHRVGVVHGDRLVNILSQSDIIKFLISRGVYIGSKIQKPIKEVGLEPLGVASILESIPTIDVIRFMRDHILSGVPIVDKNGRMIANFSASDLLGLNEKNSSSLALPVKDFINGIHRFPKSPVCVVESDTVEMVLLKMVVHHVHRVYIVDKSMKPTGVITMTDLMQFFVRK